MLVNGGSEALYNLEIPNLFPVELKLRPLLGIDNQLDKLGFNSDGILFIFMISLLQTNN